MQEEKSEWMIFVEFEFNKWRRKLLDRSINVITSSLFLINVNDIDLNAHMQKQIVSEKTNGFKSKFLHGLSVCRFGAS